MCSAWKLLSMIKPLINRVFLKMICSQLPSASICWHTYFHTPSNLPGGLFQAVHNNAQNMAIDPGFCSSPWPYPKANLLQEISTLYSRLTLRSSRYRSWGWQSVHVSTDMPTILTSTVFGKLVICEPSQTTVKNWLGVVLHSRLFKWKSSSTRKVNAVFEM